MLREMQRRESSLLNGLDDTTLEEGDHFEIEVQQRPNGRVLYVNVNGVTVFRACRIGRLNLTLNQ